MHLERLISLNNLKIFSVAHAEEPKFSLYAMGGAKNDSIFPLPNRPIGIGTDPNTCAIIYPAGTAGIESLHCQLVPQGDDWIIKDFSETGTWLNGKKIAKLLEYHLKVGDVFCVGSLENSFRLCSGIESTPSSRIMPGTQVDDIGEQDNNSQQHKKSIWKMIFNYEGRLNRKPFIIQYLPLVFFVTVLYSFIYAIASEMGSGNFPVTTFWIILLILLFIVFLILCTYGWGLCIRRLHDTDHSGWWTLGASVPLLNFYVLYLMLFKKGTQGANRFGSDPLN